MSRKISLSIPRNFDEVRAGLEGMGYRVAQTIEDDEVRLVASIPGQRVEDHNVLATWRGGQFAGAVVNWYEGQDRSRTIKGLWTLITTGLPG